MGAYQYQAITKNGISTKGVIEADSERHVRQLLRERLLTPLKIHPLAKRTKNQQKASLNAQELALFTRQLATLLAAGIPVEEALLGVSEQTEKDKLKTLIMSLRAQVLQGYSLAQSLSDFPQAFPELYRATVGSGEQTGRLDLVLEKLAHYTENQHELKQKVLQALIYPFVMIFVSMAITSFLLTFVVPKITEVFVSSGQILPPMTQLLIYMSEILRKYGLYLIIGVFLLFLGLKRYLKQPRLKKKWHGFLLKIPLLSYLIKRLDTARYIHTFSILFSAGVNVLETMRVSASVISNILIRERFDSAAIRVKEGVDISLALKETGFLSPMSTHLIASGEKSGQIATMMVHTGQHLEADVKRLIDTGLTLLEPLVILIMGAIVLFIVLATLLPIFSMEQLVN